MTIILFDATAHVNIVTLSPARLPLRGATARRNENKRQVSILWQL